MTVKLLTEHHLELLSLKDGCTGSSESIHVKIPDRGRVVMGGGHYGTRDF